MKILRITQFESGGSPLTIVTSQSDMSIPVEEAGRPDTPGVFYVEAIFEMEGEPSTPEYTAEAMRRVDPEAEANMAIYYYWTAGWFPRVNKGGVIANPDPCPLTAEQLKVCMRQLADHPAYDGHRVVSMSGPDGIGLVLADGRVTEERP